MIDAPDVRSAWDRALGISLREITCARKYLDELCRLSCAADLFALGLFPNSKEITESFAAYHAAWKHLRRVHDVNDPRNVLVAVGDGTRPRTAATFAYRSRWECWSVDPALRSDAARRVHRRVVQRLHILAQRAEDTCLDLGDRPVVIAAVHSHAPLAAARACVQTTGPVSIVAIPCCVPQRMDRPPDVEYADYGITSPMRTVRVWRAAEAAGKKT